MNHKFLFHNGRLKQRILGVALSLSIIMAAFMTFLGPLQAKADTYDMAYHNSNSACSFLYLGRWVTLPGYAGIKYAYYDCNLDQHQQVHGTIGGASYISHAGALVVRDQQNGQWSLAYCIAAQAELLVPGPMSNGGWNGDNRIKWLLQNFYPNGGVPAGHSVAEEETAIQAAIWHFANGFNLSYVVDDGSNQVDGWTTARYNALVNAAQGAVNAGWPNVGGQYWGAVGPGPTVPTSPNTYMVASVVNWNRTFLPGYTICFQMINDGGTGMTVEGQSAVCRPTGGDGYASANLTALRPGTATVREFAAGGNPAIPGLTLYGGNQTLLLASQINHQDVSWIQDFNVPVYAAPNPGLNLNVQDITNGAGANGGQTTVSGSPGDHLAWNMAPYNSGFSNNASWSYVWGGLDNVRDNTNMNLLTNTNLNIGFQYGQVLNPGSGFMFNTGSLPPGWADWGTLTGTAPATIDSTSLTNAVPFCLNPKYVSDGGDHYAAQQGCVNINYTPNMTVTKTIDGKSTDTVKAGALATFGISVQNTGNRNLPNLIVYDYVDSRLGSIQGGSNLVVNQKQSDGRTLLGFNGGNLVAGQTATFQFTAIPARDVPGTTYTVNNTASVQSPVLTQTSNTVTVNVPTPCPTPNLGLNIQAPAQLHLGKTGVYHITVSNNGSASANDSQVITNGSLTFSTSGGITITGLTSGFGTPSGTNTQTVSIPTLNGYGSSVSFDLTITVPASGNSISSDTPAPVITIHGDGIVTGVEGTYSQCGSGSASQNTSSVVPNFYWQ